MMVGPGAADEYIGQFGLHLGIGQIRGPFFSHDNDIPRRQELPVAPEKLPEEALHPVAAAGLAHLASRHQPQTGTDAFPRGQADAEMRRVQSFSSCLGPDVLLMAANPRISGKAGRCRGGGGFPGEETCIGGLRRGRERCS